MSKFLDYFLGIIFISAVLFLFIYVIPMMYMSILAQDNFCKENGFDYYSNNKVACVTDTTISNKDVFCNWGFYKFDCNWVETLEVVEVGR